MRVIVTMRGTAVIDLELCWPRRQEPGEEPPTLQAAAHPVDVSRTDGPVWADDQPAVVRAFGFGR